MLDDVKHGACCSILRVGSLDSRHAEKAVRGGLGVWLRALSVPIPGKFNSSRRLW